jgi:6-phosphogluconate dehydrogenase
VFGLFLAKLRSLRMQIGMVGLGRMGGNMARRLLRSGHEVFGYNRTPEHTRHLAAEGVVAAYSLAEFVQRLRPPRVCWLMVPAGSATESAVQSLSELLAAGDTIIDGGNSYFKDDVRRARELRTKGINYLDVGTSGGVWGLERGYCLMIGGDADTVKRLDPLFRALAPGQGDIARTPGRPAEKGTAEQGYLHCGPAGAGHFVKMVHNGIEYGVMQAYAEGLDILHSANSASLPGHLRFQFDLAEITEVWRRGSVIGSWLLDLTASALIEYPHLEKYSGYVQDSGEGRWTVQAAIEEAVPANVLSAALYARFRSRREQSFADRVLSAMREKFGGHAEHSTSAASGGAEK